MADILFTLPGKVGDNLGRIPIAYQYSKQFNTKVDVALDLMSDGVLNLIKSEPWIENAFLAHGVHDYGMGGQPWDFGRTHEWLQSYKQIFHLGYVNFPFGNITLSSINATPINRESLLTEPSLSIPYKGPKNLVISTESNREQTNINCVHTVSLALPQLRNHFEKVIFITDGNHDYYYKDVNLLDAEFFNDNKDMRQTAELMSESIVLTTYSSMSMLAYLQKTPQVVLLPGYAVLPHYDCRQSYYVKDTWAGEGDPNSIIPAIEGLLNICR